MGTEDIKKEIKQLEDEISNTPKNKSTEHHIGRLKAKIARLKDELEKRKKSGGKGEGFGVKKTGDATVGLVGFPSIGKSTLLNRLTSAKSEVGSYQFTTLDVIPGMMKYKGANIQLLDLPGLISGASKGRGRGKEVLSAVRNVDLIILMVDAKHKDGDLELMSKELYKADLRLNQKKPEVVINKTGHGGINISSTVELTHLNKKVVESICSEYFTNAHVIIREDITEDQLIDVLIGNRVYVPAITVINKIDLVSKKDLEEKINEVKSKGWDVVSISAETGKGLENLKEKIFSKLDLIRVFMKPVGEEVDREEPLILHKGDQVEDACKKIHRSFKKRFKQAIVSGPSAKHDMQKVGLDHVLKDGDILTIMVSP